MPSPGLLQQLTWQEDHARKRAAGGSTKRCLEISQWSTDENARFDELWSMRRGLTETEEEELFAILAKTRIMDESFDQYTDEDNEYLDENGDEDMREDTDEDINSGDDEEKVNDEEDDDEDGDTNESEDVVYDWDPVEFAFIITFHRYAMQYTSIRLPNERNLLNKYLIRTGCRLLQKYGWAVGQPDCSSIRPLYEWRPSDRRMLIQLYRVEI
jgi:hypothetical protein